MSTYSATPKAAALSQSAAEGAALAENSRFFPISVARNAPGALASLAWAGFGLSCLLWQDLGDWSRTHEVAIAAFVVAGGILIAALLSRSQQRLAVAGAMAAGARAVSDHMGNRDRQVRMAAIAILSAAASHHRGLHRRLAEASGQHPCVGEASACRLCARGRDRLSNRRIDWMVARRRLLGTSSPALHWAAARDGMAAICHCSRFRRAGARARS